MPKVIAALVLCWLPVASTIAQAPAPAAQGGAAAAEIDAIRAEAQLSADPALETVWLRRLAVALAAGEDRGIEHAAAVLRLSGERLGRSDPTWPPEQVDTLFAKLIVDQRRLLYDSDFRAAVCALMEVALADSVPRSARIRMLQHMRVFDFGLVETLEVAWGIAPRSSRRREVDFDSVDLEFGSVLPIRASLYSLPSVFFDAEQARAFLRSVRAFAPDRQIVVLSDQPLIAQLANGAVGSPLSLLDSLGRNYTPWPRDPFMVARAAVGGAVLVVRPNLQAQREGDVFMAREFVQNLPEALDAQLQLRWSLSPVPFHGGHMLPTPEGTWVSVHTLLPRVKEIAGISGGIDIEVLRAPQALSRFVAAVEQATAEFGEVFGLPARLVHDLPRNANDFAAFEVVLRGGDGRDLDSLVTIVPADGGGQRAFVGDLGLGADMLVAAGDSEVQVFRDLYSLPPGAAEVRRQILAAQAGAPANHVR